MGELARGGDDGSLGPREEAWSVWDRIPCRRLPRASSNADRKFIGLIKLRSEDPVNHETETNCRNK
jgi:hypothetical protein